MAEVVSGMVLPLAAGGRSVNAEATRAQEDNVQ
jgi:hypothetical protein